MAQYIYTHIYARYNRKERIYRFTKANRWRSSTMWEWIINFYAHEYSKTIGLIERAYANIFVRTRVLST